ncbi:AraC family transcriptional regulator [Paenibacillus sp. F411]|uniref:AraC family transcriptional regulator n=1 Tax=Paenibacillus sp. F411 TaxID=2820239 RepID=UPI001AAE472C|nr:AraC family transcriptional regulator [Paenibacillus sp. F411]MBO2942646.1 AraC family transcriptional regulator [Paenibacillus sp. F411]
MYYSLSRLSSLDVKWAGLFDASSPSFKWNHYNPHYQLIAAVEGPVYIRVGEQQYTLRSGESLLLLPWEQHTGWNRDERQGQFFWTQFSCSPEINVFQTGGAGLKIVHAEKTELRTNEASHEDLLVIPKLHLSNQRFTLLGLFEQLVTVSDTPQGYFRFQQTLLLGEILRLIAAGFLEQIDQHASFPTSYITYRKLVNYLNHEYEKDISKENLEQAIQRKYGYLCQVFKKYADTTIISYIHELRVQRAKHLLLNTDKSVGDIATEIGYQDSFYFSRVFKRLEGLAPQHFRNQQAVDDHN